MKAFQADLAQYAELKNQEKTTSDTLEGLLGNAEVAVKAKKVDLKTVGEDYQIFYKTAIRGWKSVWLPHAYLHIFWYYL